MALIKCKECKKEISNKAKTCPNCGAPVKRKRLGCGALILILIIAPIIISIFTTSTDYNSNLRQSNYFKKNNQIGNQKQANSSSKKIKIVFDVNNLIGKKISQIKEGLGTPSSEFIPNKIQLKFDPGILSTAEWYNDGIGLTIDFKGKERIDYIFVINDGTKHTKQQLMKMTNLSSETKRYTIKHIKKG